MTTIPNPIQIPNYASLPAAVAAWTCHFPIRTRTHKPRAARPARVVEARGSSRMHTGGQVLRPHKPTPLVVPHGVVLFVEPTDTGDRNMGDSVYESRRHVAIVLRMQ